MNTQTGVGRGGQRELRKLEKIHWVALQKISFYQKDIVVRFLEISSLLVEHKFNPIYRGKREAKTLA